MEIRTSIRFLCDDRCRGILFERGASFSGRRILGANPAAEQNCATCHFDAESVLDSEALVIIGLVQHGNGRIA